MKKSPALKSLQQAVQNSQTATAPHLMVRALAGTGKTTTLVEGLKFIRGLPLSIKNPTSQQKAIWESLSRSKDAVKVGFLAFNKTIAVELAKRIPEDCEAMTNHSFGMSILKNSFDFRLKVNEYRSNNLIAKLLGEDPFNLKGETYVKMDLTKSLVSLCKMTLTVPTKGNLEQLADYYDIDLGKYSSEVYELVPQVLDLCLQVQKDKEIDFDDMVWLPTALNLPYPKYDLLLIDESQDLNRAQQELVLRAGKRLVFVGDEKQAIYGFAGADNESITRLSEVLSKTPQGCEVLELTETFRCGRKIVELANQIVPELIANKGNCEGQVFRDTFDAETGYRSKVQQGDMILCRVNAPLVSECFKFLKMGMKAKVRGRSIGANLISFVKQVQKQVNVKENQSEIEAFLDQVYLQSEADRAKENKKKYPSEFKLMGIDDREECIEIFASVVTTVKALIEKIDSTFSDFKGNEILLSSIHKAKGLESKRVFLIEPGQHTVPHPMAKTDWQLAGEQCLRYVAITRAIEELYLVKGKYGKT